MTHHTKKHPLPHPNYQSTSTPLQQNKTPIQTNYLFTLLINLLLAACSTIELANPTTQKLTKSQKNNKPPINQGTNNTPTTNNTNNTTKNKNTATYTTDTNYKNTKPYTLNHCNTKLQCQHTALDNVPTPTNTQKNNNYLQQHYINNKLLTIINNENNKTTTNQYKQ